MKLYRINLPRADGSKLRLRVKAEVVPRGLVYEDAAQLEDGTAFYWGDLLLAERETAYEMIRQAWRRAREGRRRWVPRGAVDVRLKP